LKPEELSGMLIVVPVVNMPVFRFRTPWFNLRSSISPMDGRDINRLFPGDSNGSVTSVLAHTIRDTVEG